MSMTDDTDRHLWPHRTAEEIGDYADRAGVDLFDDEVDGKPMTAIYVRYRDGTRWPARTVSMGDPEHLRSVLAAWAETGPVNDYRKSAAAGAAPVKQIEDVHETE